MIESRQSYSKASCVQFFWPTLYEILVQSVSRNAVLKNKVVQQSVWSVAWMQSLMVCYFIANSLLRVPVN